MSFIESVNVALAGINLVLALVLGSVYLRNLKEIRSPFTWGLILFALFLAVHNAIFLYHAFTMMAVNDIQTNTFLLVEGVLQTGGLAALVYATLR